MVVTNDTDDGAFLKPHLTDYISGCGILVRREVVEDVGDIDERFFYYKEETEWCLRARKSGWKIMLVPKAKLWHKGVTIDHEPQPAVTYYATRNRLLTLSKHQAPIPAKAYVWAQLLRTLTSWTVKPRWRSMREHRDALWQGIIDFLRGSWGQMSS